MLEFQEVSHLPNQSERAKEREEAAAARVREIERVCERKQERAMATRERVSRVRKRGVVERTKRGREREKFITLGFPPSPPCLLSFGYFPYFLTLP